jgi:hypothetical protein
MVQGASVAAWLIAEMASQLVSASRPPRDFLPFLGKERKRVVTWLFCLAAG